MSAGARRPMTIWLPSVKRMFSRMAPLRATCSQKPAGAAGSGSGDFFTPLATTPLIEGVTPAGREMAKQDYTMLHLASYLKGLIAKNEVYGL